MEQHPVPQNVTTFQFRLIGDMTVKQFGYLAGGLMLGYICYKLPLPFFFRYPLAFIAGLGGFCFAFVPIEQRPMDLWISSFIKNVYNPTQYVWQKKPMTPVQTKAAAPKPVAHPLPTVENPLPTQPLIPKAAPIATTTQVSQKAKGSFTETLSAWFSSVLPQKTQATVALPTYEQVKKQKPVVPAPAAPTKHTQPTLEKIFKNNPTTQSHPNEALILSTTFGSDMIQSIKRFFSFEWIPIKSRVAHVDPFARYVPPQTVQPTQPLQQMSQPAPTNVNVAEVKDSTLAAIDASISAIKEEAATDTSLEELRKLQAQMTDLLSEREKLEKELLTLRQQSQRPPQQPPVKPVDVATPQNAAQVNVRIIKPEAAVNAGLPRLTTFPNVVTGIIKDPNGNLVPGVLVTIADRDGIPLRALKSNKLGQFAASTPLPNGTYVVEIEDPRKTHTFDRIQITLDGQVAPPIEVHAKSQKQIARDKLAKEIFGDKVQ